MASGYTTDAIGGTLVAEQVAGLLIEPLAAEAVVLRAGPRVFVADGAPLLIPKILSVPLADPWRSENTLIAETDPVFGEVQLLPTSLKSLKVIHRVSNELARNAEGDVGSTLATALVTRVARALDGAMLGGTGAANTITGLANATGVQVIAAVGALTVDRLLDAVGLSLAQNAKPSAWFMAPRDFMTLRKMKTTTGEYLVNPDPREAASFTLLGIPVYLSTEIAVNGGAGVNESSVILADMSQVAVGRDGDLGVTFLQERYADYDQLGLRVTGRFDIAPLNASGVVVLRGVTS